MYTAHFPFKHLLWLVGRYYSWVMYFGLIYRPCGTYLRLLKCVLADSNQRLELSAKPEAWSGDYLVMNASHIKQCSLKVIKLTWACFAKQF